ncbi:MAG: hypothetical protein FWB86_08525 [Treponema sp.]|nr:hypothetical protein [Treponema sp.]MCL2252060.1 hypothetical protein [Treponema sp.]
MKKLLFIFILIFSLNSCVGLMEKTGRFLDGSQFTEKTLSKYSNKENQIDISFTQNKQGEKSIIISLKNYPMMILRASFPNDEGAFYLVTLEYLSGSTHGWNEFTLDILGTSRLVYTNDTDFYLEPFEDIEKVQITQGRIHRYDTRILGNDALTSLRNRRERITSIAHFMNSITSQNSFNNNNFKKDIKTFENYWKPILLPEMVSGKKRPENWHNKGDIYQKAEDISWNTSYTERIFPDELLSVRNSGTLLRDWEEAHYWLYLEYEWENIVKIFSQEINFIKTK